MNVERKFLVVLFLTGGAAMTGCTSEKAEDKQPSATTLPNPAAVFCAEKGGTYEIRRADDGSETGICILADGTEVDAWAYLREQ
jgi:putative hemolysin